MRSVVPTCEYTALTSGRPESQRPSSPATARVCSMGVPAGSSTAAVKSPALRAGMNERGRVAATKAAAPTASSTLAKSQALRSSTRASEAR